MNIPVTAAVRRTFPFDRPWSGDGIFWWAVVVSAVSILAFTVTSVDDTGTFVVAGWIFNVILGVPLNFLVFVLPVVGVRALVRARRPAVTVAVHAPRSPRTTRVAPVTSSARKPSVVTPPAATATSPATTTRTIAVKIDGGQITFARAASGTVTATVSGFNGRPSAGTVRRARAAITQRQKRAGQQPWF